MTYSSANFDHKNEWFGMNGYPTPPADAIVRYADGSFAPIMFHYASEGCNARAIAAENGFDLKAVAMADEVDDEDALYRAYFEEGASDVVRKWQPPEIEGWRLVGKTDSEDGPQAFYIRPRNDEAADAGR